MRGRTFFARKAGKRDANHASIRDGLKKLGYLVIDLAGAGDGVPDLLVFSRLGRVVFIEVKTAKGVPNEAQLAFAATLSSYDVKHCYARTLAEALRVVG